MALIAWVANIIAAIMDDIGTLAFATLKGFCYHRNFWYKKNN
jgi:hypothetical protein